MAEKSYIVSYDIRNPKRLHRVHQTMCDYGNPRQYSVFECTLTDKNLVRLKHRLSEIIDHEADQVLIIPLCGTCAASIEAIGSPRQTESARAIII